MGNNYYIGAVYGGMFLNQDNLNDRGEQTFSSYSFTEEGSKLYLNLKFRA
ncbi:MAG: hypothetical protein ACRCYA_06675 [Cetobacterium sp.]